MAGLSFPQPESRDRAQLLLVGAFALAVVFVALALVVNAAIYTENLATRGTVPGSDDALEQRHQVEQSVGAVIEYVNEYNYTSLGDIQGNVENISRDVNRQQILMGRAINVKYDSKVEGRRITQRNESNRAFTNNTDFPEWVLATGVDNTRGFTIEVTDLNQLSSGSPFTVVANDSGKTWEMEIDDSSKDLTVSVNSDGDTESCDRSVSGTEAVIDVTNGLVVGEPCAALRKLTAGGENMSFANDLSSYDIEFENGNNIAGNYSLVIDSTSPNVNSLYDASSDITPPSDVPYYTDAIYSVTVEYAYQTPDVAYVTEIEVAPGEPR